MPYQPIENYGTIGNMRTAALVGMDGSIDWFCFPNFDAPSVFGAILDDKQGGYFKIAPTAKDVTQRQLYWPDSNVLITHFVSPDGCGEVTDFMPVSSSASGFQGRPVLVRRVRGVRGPMAFRLECRPAFNYGRDPHETRVSAGGASFHSSTLSLGLGSVLPLRKIDNAAVAEFTLRDGETKSFCLDAISPTADGGVPLSEFEAETLFLETVDYWRQWISKCNYTGRWRESVHRSALALQLMSYEPTGAIIAAPSCSLPENIGGVRNWDYRCSWIRDSAFTVYALLRVGFTDAADRFIHWLESRCKDREPDGALQTVYGIDGRRALPEEVLNHWEGYRGSRPVRIGNDAYHQIQMDIYGELMDAVYLYNKHRGPISSALWGDLARLLDWVCDHWRREDNGIWEVRGGRQHFVYSKLMCWVALDRGLRLATQRSFPADRDRWLKCRNQIYEEILSKGWSEKRQAFLQYYGGHSLDASALMMPLVFFMSPTDPKMVKTLDAICQPLAKGGLLFDGAVCRYNLNETKDGLEGDEGSFNMCTFWLVEALTRLGRTDPAHLEKARWAFERMLAHANHLGLYSEETGSRGEALGNFPQAFAHLALISAAVNLDHALGGAKSGDRHYVDGWSG